MLVPEPRFYLKNLKAIEPTLICMQVKYDGQRVFLSTGDKVLPCEWDFTTQRTKANKRNIGNGDINMWLDKMSNEFKSIFRNCMLDGRFPDAVYMMQKLQENLNMISKPKQEEKIPLTFFTFIDLYIKECESTKSIATVKSYKATLHHLKNHSLLEAKHFDFNDISLAWRASFIKYLQGCGVARVTEGKHIKIVKVFMNEATERGLNQNMDFRSKSFSKPTEDVSKIFLTKAEIEKLYSLDLSGDKMKDIVRDYFVISCMTSLRYSDFIDIKAENIKKDTIEMITKKTGEKVVIPLATIIKEIFKKYNYELPKAPCNQVFNRVLKDVGEMAELNDSITITKTIGGIKQTKVYKKYELLTCHTGRRTMITNSILAGIPTPSIMLISAHKNLKVFQGYVRLDQHQNAEALATHSYFQ